MTDTHGRVALWLGIVSAVISIFSFLTGIQSVRQLRSLAQNEPLTQRPAPTATTPATPSPSPTRAGRPTPEAAKTKSSPSPKARARSILALYDPFTALGFSESGLASGGWRLFLLVLATALATLPVGALAAELDDRRILTGGAESYAYGLAVAYAVLFFLVGWAKVFPASLLGELVARFLDFL